MHSSRSAMLRLFAAAVAIIFTLLMLPHETTALPVMRDTHLIAKNTLPFVRVRDICNVYYEGRTQITEYCDPPYVCDRINKKCKPGPELQRQMDEERERREAEIRKQEENLKKIEAGIRNLQRSTRTTHFQRSGSGTRFDDRRANCSDITGLSGSSGSLPCNTNRGGRVFAQPSAQPGAQVPRRSSEIGTTVRETTRLQYQVILPIIERRNSLPADSPEREVLNRQISEAVAKAKTSGTDLDDWVKSRADNQPQQISGASNPADTSSNSMPRHWQGSGEKDDCESANSVERNTAGWYNMCGPDYGDSEPSWSYRPSSYLPPVDPRKLAGGDYAATETQCKSRIRETSPDIIQRCIIDAAANLAARAACRSALAETRNQCFLDKKVEIALREVPDIASRCTMSDREGLVACVDYIWTFGPRRYTQSKAYYKANYKPEATASLSDPEKWAVEQQALAQRSGGRCAPPQSVNSTLGHCCPSGQGMKPTRGGFGGWSCQPLGIIYLARDREPRTGQEVPANPEVANAAFELGVNQLAGMAAVVAAEITGASVPAARRKTCFDAAFATAHSVMKGGAVQVLPDCKPMARAARAALLHYASAHAGNVGNPGVEELLETLAQLNTGPNPTRPATGPDGKALADEEACFRSIVSRGEGAEGGFLSRIFGNAAKAPPVPEFCKAYLSSSGKSEESKTPRPSRLQLNSADMNEVRSMASEFKRDNLLPPDYAGAQ